jgi:glutaminyl-tRNA synthetase
VNQIIWVAVADALQTEVLYDRLFTEAHPEADKKDFLENLNPHSLSVVTAYLEPSLEKYQQASGFSLSGMGTL